jgi:predicted small secreted protein
MKKYRVIIGVVLVLGALVSARESAAQNIDLMAKWTAATVVHYKVTAEFSGEAPIGMARGMVTDRFEVEFDWNQSEFAMIGTPTIKNFPSKLVSLLKTGCTNTVSGAFEHATIIELRNDPTLAMANAVHAEVQRDLPASTVAGPSERGPCAYIRQAPAQSVRQGIAVPAPNGMMLAMPGGGGYQHNGKAFIIKDTSPDQKGWTYTVTPTIVQ